MKTFKIRINKYLAQQGVASRRAADQLITQGKVLVNGHPAKLGEKIDPDTDKIEVNGLSVQSEVQLEYIALNKPKGFVSTTSDEFNRRKVTDLVPSKNRLFPVGRLDEDSHGLILLTNDGALAQRLTHPKFHLPKTYHLVIQGMVSDYQLDKLQHGIWLKEGKTLPTKVKILASKDNRTTLEMILFEGRNRQIRRMCGKLNLQLLDLARIAIGQVKLGSLKLGESRALTTEEVESLKSFKEGLAS